MRRGRLVGVLTAIAAVGAGLSAGVYLAFSTFVMPGLRDQPPRQAIGAMNAINRAAPQSPLLMLVLLGTGLLCVVLLIVGIVRHDEPAAWWRMVGAALYLLSVFILIGYHVPHNEQLMQIDPSDVANADAIWGRFFSGWMLWNQLRTLSAASGAVGFVVALKVR